MAIFFSLVLWCNSSRDLIEFALFKLNQDYIATMLCINRDKPEMKCDGKCYLKKSLTKSTEEKQSLPVAPPDEKAPVIMDGQLPVLRCLATASSSTPNFAYLPPVTGCNTDDILHPPRS